MTLQEQLRKLNPSFDDCPAPCAIRYEEGEQPTDLPDLCERCDVRAQIGFYEAHAREEIERRFPEGCEWSFQTLEADVTRVQRIDRQVRGKGYPRGCDELTARLLDIMRREEYRPLRIMRWESEQKRRSES